MTPTKSATKDKDLLGRLSSAGEEAMQKLGDLPGGKALVDTAHNFRERLDELATRIRAIDPLEKRVTALEKRVGALEKPTKKSSGTTRSKTTTKSSGP